MRSSTFSAGLRAAKRLGGADLAIAQLRLALASKGGGNARKLLGSVPEEARRDPGYLLARTYLLRHDEKIAEAAQVMLSAPTDLAQVHDGEDWWVERRIMARKLLDIGDARSAYCAVAEAAECTQPPGSSRPSGAGREFRRGSRVARERRRSE